MGTFEIKKRSNGDFQFNLKAGNGEVIGTSEMYSSVGAHNHGIDSVKRNGPKAVVEDGT